MLATFRQLTLTQEKSHTIMNMLLLVLASLTPMNIAMNTHTLSMERRLLTPTLMSMNTATRVRLIMVKLSQRTMFMATMHHTNTNMFKPAQTRFTNIHIAMSTPILLMVRRSLIHTLMTICIAMMRPTTLMKLLETATLIPRVIATTIATEMTSSTHTM